MNYILCRDENYNPEFVHLTPQILPRQCTNVVDYEAACKLPYSGDVYKFIEKYKKLPTNNELKKLIKKRSKKSSRKIKKKRIEKRNSKL